MSPRARRSESITLPPGNQPGLIRYNDDLAADSEKTINAESYESLESDSDSTNNDLYDSNDTDGSDSDSASEAEEGEGRGR